MKTLAFTAPILPGKSDHCRRIAKEVAGPRYKEMTESRQALGQTRETTWIQATPMGDILVVYLEGADSVRANKGFAASKSPFDLWFKQQAQSFTGIDFSQPLPDGFVEVIHESQRNKTNGVRSLATAFPILPGKTAEWRRAVEDLVGPRLNEVDEFHQRHGFTKWNWYLQHTPQGDLFVLYLEGPDPNQSFLKWIESDHPFDVWFKKQAGTFYGIDFDQPPSGPPPELGFDWKA